MWEIRVNITTSKREHCSVLPGDTEGGDAARRAGDGGCCSDGGASGEAVVKAWAWASASTISEPV